jgi:hypothetical protein
VLGHGDTERLILHNGEELTGFRRPTRTDPGTNGNIRALITEARQRKGASFKFNLRLVHMCNCLAASVNDDWLAIGAQTVVGTRFINWMPEPMITFFWDDFVKNDKRVIEAASDSYAASSAIWQVVPGYATRDASTHRTKIQDSVQVVSGNGNLIFKDECQLKVNESRSFVVRANKSHSFPGIYLVAGQKYKITAIGTWNSGGLFTPTVNANGYTPGPLDAGRRYSANMMCLIGERFRHDDNALSFVSGSGFKIGANKTFTSGGHGFLNLFANDNILSYLDNSGQVTVTVKRTN